MDCLRTSKCSSRLPLDSFKRWIGRTESDSVSSERCAAASHKDLTIRLRSIDRPINVTRLIIENSIESRIIALQEKKSNLAASALGDDTAAAGRVSPPPAGVRSLHCKLTATCTPQLTPEDLRFLFSL